MEKKIFAKNDLDEEIYRLETEILKKEMRIKLQERAIEQERERIIKLKSKIATIIFSKEYNKNGFTEN